jgi:hypothetical protein
MSSSISSLPPNQSEIPALIQETGAAINKLLPSLKELVPVLQKFSDTVGDGRVQAQTLAEPVTLNKNEVSLASALRAYKKENLDNVSFECLLETAKIFKNNHNPALLKNIKEWQSTVADNGKSLREKELAFAAAMQNLEETFKAYNQTPELEEVLKLTKYIVNRSPVPRFSFKTYSGDDSNDTKLLQYAQEVRVALSPAISYAVTAPAVSPKSPNLDPEQRLGVRQNTEQALKQLMSMCSASSPAGQPISSDNFLDAVEELKKTTFQDKASSFGGKSYEQNVIGCLREWDKANKVVAACLEEKILPYLRLRLELLTSMVLQEILQSTSHNNMEQFKEDKGLLKILDFMMKQPVNNSKTNNGLLSMFPQPGKHSLIDKLLGNSQTPLDTSADRRLISAFKDSGTKYPLSSGLQASLAKDYLNISRNSRVGLSGYLIQK